MRFPSAILVVLGLAAIATAQEAPRAKIPGLSHIALYVHNIAKSRAFYHDYLGFDEPFHVDNPDGTLHLTWMKINDRQTIELFPEKQPGTLRVYHMSIETDDAEKVRQLLAAHNVKVPPTVPKGKIGNANFTIPDSDGHMLEIVTYEPDGWTIREKGNFLPPTRISDHMAYLIVPVSTFDKASDFYQGILGFRRISRSDSAMRLGVPDGNDYIEFIKYTDVSRAQQKNREQHIGLAVKDVAAAMEILKGRPLPKECRAPSELQTTSDGRKRVTLYDPDRTHIELVEEK